MWVCIVSVCVCMYFMCVNSCMRMHSNVITLRESSHQIVPRVTPNVCDSGHNFGDFRFNSVASEEIPFYTNSVVV